MPILKVIYEQPRYFAEQSGRGKYHDEDAVETVVNYCLCPDKTPHHFIGGYGVNLKQAGYEMNRLAEAFDKDHGVRLRHMVLSFSQTEQRQLSLERDGVNSCLNEIAQYAIAYYGHEYQILYAVHEDTRHSHIHMVMNTVNYKTGKKYAGRKEDYYNFQNYLKSFLKENFDMILMVEPDRRS